MFHVIKRARARPNHTVEIEWKDGGRAVVDFSTTLKKGGVFAALADKNFFVKKMSVGGGGDWLSWPGNVDFSADSLWYRAHPKKQPDEIAAAR